jgi:hypothetical protein
MLVWLLPGSPLHFSEICTKFGAHSAILCQIHHETASHHIHDFKPAFSPSCMKFCTLTHKNLLVLSPLHHATTAVQLAALVPEIMDSTVP